jgi:hypothetical protein
MALLADDESVQGSLQMKVADALRKTSDAHVNRELMMYFTNPYGRRVTVRLDRSLALPGRAPRTNF